MVKAQEKYILILLPVTILVNMELSENNTPPCPLLPLPQNLKLL